MPQDGPPDYRDRPFSKPSYPGLRVGELAGLNVDDLELGDGLATVRGKAGERLALIGEQRRSAGELAENSTHTRAARLNVGRFKKMARA